MNPHRRLRRSGVNSPNKNPKRKFGRVNTKAYVGKRILKKFCGYGEFSGKITEYCPKLGLFMVEYEDGDKEELRQKEVDALIHRYERHSKKKRK